MKPKKQKTYKCPSCRDGRTRLQHIAYELVTKKGKRIVIPDLEVEVCDNCGERIFSSEAARQIEAHKQYSGRLLLRLDPDLHMKLAERATAHHRSLNEEINSILTECLRRAS